MRPPTEAASFGRIFAVFWLVDPPLGYPAAGAREVSQYMAIGSSGQFAD